RDWSSDVCSSDLNDGIPVHGFDHFRGHSTRSRDTDEHIRTHQLLGQSAGLLLQVGHLRHLFLDPVESITASINRSLTVAHGDVTEASGEEQLDNGNGGGTGTGGNDFHILLLLVHDLERVEKTGQGNDGSAMLVI